MSRRKVIQFPIQTGPILPRQPDLGEPPEYYDQHLRDIWFELQDLAPARMLWKSDRADLDLAVTILDELRRNPGRKGAKTKRKMLNSILFNLRFALKVRKRLLANTEKRKKQVSKQ